MPLGGMMLALFNKISSQFEGLKRAMDDRKTILLKDAAAAMNIKPEKVDHSLCVMIKRGLFGENHPYVDDALKIVILDRRYAVYASVKDSLEKFGTELIRARHLPKQLEERRRRNNRGGLAAGVGGFLADLAGNVLEGKGAKRSFLNATDKFVRGMGGSPEEKHMDTQPEEEMFTAMLSKAREMNNLMAAHPDHSWSQETGEWLNDARLSVQNWEGYFEAAVGKTEKGTALQLAESKLANETAPELERRVAQLKRAFAMGEGNEKTKISREILDCCDKLTENRNKIENSEMRQAIDETMAVLNEICVRLSDGTGIAGNASVRSLRNCYLPAVQTLTEKYAAYEKLRTPDRYTQEAMTEAEHVIIRVVPNALNKLNAELQAGSAIDMESEAIALKQKLQMDGLMSFRE